MHQPTGSARYQTGRRPRRQVSPGRGLRRRGPSVHRPGCPAGRKRGSRARFPVFKRWPGERGPLRAAGKRRFRSGQRGRFGRAQSVKTPRSGDAVWRRGLETRPGEGPIWRRPSPWGGQDDTARGDLSLAVSRTGPAGWPSGMAQRDGPAGPTQWVNQADQPSRPARRTSHLGQTSQGAVLWGHGSPGTGAEGRPQAASRCSSSRCHGPRPSPSRTSRQRRASWWRRARCGSRR